MSTVQSVPQVWRLIPLVTSKGTHTPLQTRLHTAKQTKSYHQDLSRQCNLFCYTIHIPQYTTIRFMRTVQSVPQVWSLIPVANLKGRHTPLLTRLHTAKPTNTKNVDCLMNKAAAAHEVGYMMRLATRRHSNLF